MLASLRNISPAVSELGDLGDNFHQSARFPTIPALTRRFSYVQLEAEPSGAAFEGRALVREKAASLAASFEDNAMAAFPQERRIIFYAIDWLDSTKLLV